LYTILLTSAATGRKPNCSQ